MKTNAFLLLPALTGILHAGPRTSASYSLPTDTTDAGGRRSASASYSNDASIGGVTGRSNVAAPAETARHGYIGQLYEVTGLQLAATPATVNEGATRQISASSLLDDATTFAVPAASVTWSVLSGPLTINASGLTLAGTVYQDTAATVQGVLAGRTGTLGITVLNTLLDNFGTYAADGIVDSWQVQYFGLNNPNGGPNADPDADGQDNLFEYNACLVPTDPNSRFRLSFDILPGQPLAQRITISPRYAGCEYILQSSTSLLSPSWIDLTEAPFTDQGEQRTFTGLNAASARKFYRVKPTRK